MHLKQQVTATPSQTLRVSPLHVQASEIVAWNSLELEAAIERELAENPALELVDEEAFGDVAVWSPQEVGVRPEASVFSIKAAERDGFTSAPKTLSPADPADWLASDVTLREYLRDNAGQFIPDDFPYREAVYYLIECLDERGYLVADLCDAADRLGITCAQIHEAVRVLQRVEPAGVGARDLRECLLLQCEARKESDPERVRLPIQILKRCWEDLAGRRDSRIAQTLGVSRERIADALEYLRSHCLPHPAAGFRAEHAAVCGGSMPGAILPDIVFARVPQGIDVQLTRDFARAVRISPEWESLADSNTIRDSALPASEKLQRSIARDHVDLARNFTGGLAKRSRTLLRIANALSELQQGFIETGDRAFLRPLTRLQLAGAIQTDESLVSRAVSDKWAQLANGDVVPLDTFFGNANAAREALVRLIESEDCEHPYSDVEIASLLTAQGFPVARRTVTKYRNLERILPNNLRRRCKGK